LWEREHKLDPLNAADAKLDSDSDGYSNLEEYLAKSNPWDDTSIPAGSCGEDTVVLTQLVYPNNQIATCQGSILIFVGPDVTVSAGADVTYSAPLVILRSGFRAATGSVVHVDNGLAP